MMDEEILTEINDEYDDELLVSIKVIGVGGAGCNAVNRMKISGLEHVELFVANTDSQVLLKSEVENQILLGKDITGGLGAGADPEVGKKAALASEEELKSKLRDADMVFIAAGMGGGTGTGAAPVIARICKELNILTVGIVTRPFTFEGKTRNKNAVSGLQELRPYVDSLIVISNDQLLQMLGNVPIKNSFSEIDNILCQSVKTIADLLTQPATINLDFADVRTVMKDKGTALIGMGVGSGDKKAKQAAINAVTSPLLEASIEGAKNAIVNITGGPTMSILDAQDAVEVVRGAAQDSDINIIFGVALDDSLGDEMHVTVIATEFDGSDIHNVIHKDETKNKKIIEEFNINDLNINDLKEEKKEEIKSFDIEVEDDDFIPSFLRKRN